MGAIALLDLVADAWKNHTDNRFDPDYTYTLPDDLERACCIVHDERFARAIEGTDWDGVLDEHLASQSVAIVRRIATLMDIYEQECKHPHSQHESALDLVWDEVTRARKLVKEFDDG